MPQRGTDAKPTNRSILLVDIVSFSTRPVDEQLACVEQLYTVIIDACAQRGYLDLGQPVLISTGDGFFVVFTDPLAPLEVAVDIQKAVRDGGATFHIRQAIHFGKCHILDLPKAGLPRDLSSLILGPTMNTARRICDLGDANHILSSGTFYELVAEAHPDWSRCAKCIGTFEVKHGAICSIYNYWNNTDQWGRDEDPAQPCALNRLLDRGMKYGIPGYRKAVYEVSTGRDESLVMILIDKGSEENHKEQTRNKEVYDSNVQAMSELPVFRLAGPRLIYHEDKNPFCYVMATTHVGTALDRYFEEAELPDCMRALERGVAYVLAMNNKSKGNKGCKFELPSPLLRLRDAGGEFRKCYSRRLSVFWKMMHAVEEACSRVHKSCGFAMPDLVVANLAVRPSDGSVCAFDFDNFRTNYDPLYSLGYLHGSLQDCENLEPGRRVQLCDHLDMLVKRIRPYDPIAYVLGKIGWQSVTVFDMWLKRSPDALVRDVTGREERVAIYEMNRLSQEILNTEIMRNREK